MRHVTEVSIYIDPFSIAIVRGTDHGLLGKITLCEVLKGETHLHDCGLALAMPCQQMLCVVLWSPGSKLSCPCGTDMYTEKGYMLHFFVCVTN
jgi:hypothetical protein